MEQKPAVILHGGSDYVAQTIKGHLGTLFQELSHCKLDAINISVCIDNKTRVFNLNISQK